MERGNFFNFSDYVLEWIGIVIKILNSCVDFRCDNIKAYAKQNKQIQHQPLYKFEDATDVVHCTLTQCWFNVGPASQT